MKSRKSKISRCWSPRHVVAACAAAATLGTPANAQNDALQEGDRVMATLGGVPNQIGRFIARCPPGEHIAGFDLAVGGKDVSRDGVFALQPICVRALAPAVAGPFSSYASAIGGQGFYSRRLTCPGSTPVVTKMKVQVSNKPGNKAGYWDFSGSILSVNGIQIYCGLADAAPSMHAEGPSYWGHLSYAEEIRKIIDANSRCADGLVAVGISGQSLDGDKIDSLGLICGFPVLTPGPAVRAQGRVVVPGSPVKKLPICDAARLARARNSPAAPGLEAQCAAAGEAAEPGLKAQGRVVIPGAPVRKLPICDAARLARARNSPAAPGLEAQCAAAGEAAQPAPAAPPAQPAQTARVMLDVEVFDAPGGAGNRTGFLNADTIVGFIACQPDNWCHVNGDNVPNGDGWVYSGPDYRSLQI